MKKALLILLILSSVVFPQQQKTISGIVVNKENNIPLEFANITIVNSNKGTTTNSKGYFELKGKFSGEQKLRISFLGFYPKTITVNQLENLEENTIELESKILPGQTVMVEAGLGKKGEVPITISKINRKDIEDSYINQDIPEFLSNLPSTTFYSESGNGTGYTYISIRGFDQRRISISVNGIPQNDPEDHNLYWNDMPDLLESTEIIQVQRGAGSGVMGYPAIGGAINLITSNFSNKAKFDISSTLGSYNTRKYSAQFSSGLINNKYSFYAKISNILSTGYRNDAWINYKSYHLSAVRYDEKLTTQINFFGGPIRGGLVYNGLPKDVIENEDLRKVNYSYWAWDKEKQKFQPWSTLRRNDEKEYFFQPHFEILNEYEINKNVKVNSALFMVLGEGYFDYDGSWSIYSDDYFRLKANNLISANQKVKNALIRAQVENKQFGWIPRVSISHKNGKLVFGGELRYHRSIHWGSIQYGEDIPSKVNSAYRYYEYKGGKNILNAFVHENYNLTSNISLLAELQLAYHKYKIYDEKYVNTNFEVDDIFFNPRFGLNYKLNQNSSLYFAFARVSREPRLKNYYDAAESGGGATPQFEYKIDANKNRIYNFENPLVKPEVMNDFEMGYNFSTKKLELSANLFYMIFKNEIVKKGQLDRFGQPITGNIEQTIHSGIELSVNYKVNSNIQIILNGSYGNNYINKGKTYLDYEDKPLVVDLKDNKISGFPEFTFNGIIKLNYKGFDAQILGKYVGDFYSDNFDDNLSVLAKKYPGITDYTDNKVDAYFVTNINASYKLKLNSYLSNLKIFVQVNNLFDKLYATYAVGNEFYPAAERNILAGIKIGL